MISNWPPYLTDAGLDTFTQDFYLACKYFLALEVFRKSLYHGESSPRFGKRCTEKFRLKFIQDVDNGKRNMLLQIDIQIN